MNLKLDPTSFLLQAARQLPDVWRKWLKPGEMGDRGGIFGPHSINVEKKGLFPEVAPWFSGSHIFYLLMYSLTLQKPQQLKCVWNKGFLESGHSSPNSSKCCQHNIPELSTFYLSFPIPSMTAHQNRTVSEKPLKKTMPMEQKPWAPANSLRLTTWPSRHEFHLS